MRLSAHQARIVAARARGLSTAETAASLNLSPHTVKSHLRDAARTLGSTSTTHLVALAIAHREIPAGTALGTAVDRSGETGPPPGLKCSACGHPKHIHTGARSACRSCGCIVFQYPETGR